MRFNYNEDLPLFVIGAGASVEFGYPTGKDLKKQVKEILDLGVAGFDCEALNTLCNESEANFINACNILSKGLENLPFSTIDNCIRFYSSDNEYVKFAGNLAITKVISDLEFNEKSLFKSKNKLRQEDSWLNSFFELVTRHLSKDEARARFSRIPIITFNYDRNLEKYMDYISQSFERGTNFSKSIVHMYGSLPRESDFAKEGRDLVNWSRDIKTYTEAMNQRIDQRNYGRISESKSIVFLGFGYDEVNMNLLSKFLYPSIEKKIYGTAYNMNEDFKENVINKLSSIFNAEEDNIKLYDTTCKDFFSKFTAMGNFS
ncbi:MAG: hypothetical protein LBU89_03765 [Fibromonadaceae bacterium]|jgi:hypothetical protein|nr:hypothetical protein [Fibromonadaceae bacterium]